MKTTTIKRTEVKAARNQASHDRELILALLEWDDLEYGNFLMQMAEAYLMKQCGPDVYGIEFLLKSPMFWAWWRNHWAQRDSRFLTHWADCNCLEEVCEEYQALHCAANLHMRPHRVVMEKSYMYMVQDVIDGKELCK